MPGWHISSGSGGAGGGSGDVEGPASSTDNAIARFDGTTGKLQQNSAVTVSDPAANVVTVATTAGNALTVDVTEPAATTGASVAGLPAVLNAGDAVASTDTAGAAAGGDLTLKPGNAARNTSGNARGGVVRIGYPTGIGTGEAGGILLSVGTGFGAVLRKSATGNRKVELRGYDESAGNFDAGETTLATDILTGQVGATYQVNSTGFTNTSSSGFKWTSGASAAAGEDTGLFRAALGSVSVRGTTNGFSSNIRAATATVNLSGATSTASALFPAACIRLGVTARVTTAATSGDGGTSINVGDGTDADRYGAAIAFALGTTVTMANATDDPSSGGWVGATGDVVFTCNGGTFSGGVVRVVAHYLDLTAPTS